MTTSSNKVIGFVGEVFPHKSCECAVCGTYLQNDWGFVLQDLSTVCKDQSKCSIKASSNARKNGLIKSWKDA